jgi:uroporphyrinogen-III synthase
MASNIKKILVSQPKPTTDKSPYYDIAEKYGVEIIFRPFIKIDAVNAKEFRRQRINILDHTAVIFTAKTAIDHFFRLAEELRVQIPETMKYFCVTEAVAVYLQKYTVYRKRKIFYPNSGKLEDLIPSIVKNSKESFLVPASDVHKDHLIRLLDEREIQYNMAIMYRTVSNDFGPEEEFNYNILLFFSPSGISSLLKNFPDFEQGDTIIGTFGPTTAKAVRDAGLRLDIEAPAPESPSMTGALENYLKSLKTKKNNNPAIRANIYQTGTNCPAKGN